MQDENQSIIDVDQDLIAYFLFPDPDKPSELRLSYDEEFKLLGYWK